MNKKIFIVIIVAIPLLASLAVIGRSKSTTHMDHMQAKSSSSAKKPLSQNMVVMANLAFSPDTLTVKKGTTVTWRNDDSATHTITFDDSTLSSANSDLTPPGKTFQHTFDQVGTFNYHCTPHPFMQAKIVVTE